MTGKNGKPLLGFLLSFLATAAPAVAFRGAAVLERPGDGRFGSLRPWILEIAVASVWAAILVAIGSRFPTRRGRIAVVAVLLSWVLLLYANLEYIVALDAPLSFDFVEFLGSGTFLEGSALSVTHSHLLLAAIAVASALGWVAHPWMATTRRSAWVVASCCATVVALVVAWRPPGDVERWRSGHFVETAIRPVERAQALGEGARVEVARELRADLDGAPRAQIPQRKNVILLMVEGLSAGYESEIAAHHGVVTPYRMPTLSARSALRYRSFFSLQRQTNRGTYSILCGEPEKLRVGTPRMTQYRGRAERTCLPHVLSDRGYHTAYLQAAPLGFMGKDRFMRAVGFETIRGAEHFLRAETERHPWGANDRQFLTGALEDIAELRATGRPYFVTLLTVGTHHPYVVPDSYTEDPEALPHVRAVRFADIAVGEFLAALERRGDLEDTLVILTSDESAGFDAPDRIVRALSNQFGILQMEGPGITPGVVDEVFVQNDLALSIIDYLGIRAPAAEFTGRSVFRRYDRPRAVVFGNVHHRHMFRLDEQSRLHMSADDGSAAVSVQLDPARLFGPFGQVIAAVDEEHAKLRRMAAYFDEDRGNAEGPWDLLEPRTYELANVQSHVLGGMPGLLVNPDRALQVRIDVEASVPGGGRIQPLHDLVIDGAAQPFALPPLRDGERFEISYRFTSAESHVLGVMFRVRNSVPNAQIVARLSQVAIVPRQPGEPEGPHAHAMRTNGKLGARLGAPPAFEDRFAAVETVSGLDAATADVSARGAALRFDLGAPSATLRLTEVVDWMLVHADVPVVVRGASAADLARVNAEVRPRMYLEVDSLDSIRDLRELGFPNVLFDVAGSDADDDDVLAMVTAANPFGVVARAMRIERAGFADRVAELGIPVYCVPGRGQLACEDLRQAGVHGIYADASRGSPGAFEPPVAP